MAAAHPLESSPAQTPPAAEPNGGEYVVVARRYRPQTFDELIGQEHVARALSNAIAANRVGHAYLFTGARGVGKTSAARILAKALDCQDGPTATPCNQCDICQSISAGSDVDVLEIDGASNRGIDEIRQLRSNVNIRPSRARFKIYIIDEVHMLTREAFNALLKTLEEPPEHVKFIFCTTEPTKIPITILSRCQRFDFAGIRPASIAERLAQIVAAEGVAADPEALALLARRANGSLRDSQSLLEQLLTCGEKRITAADVHAMLGTAGEARLGTLADRLVQRDAAGALSDLDAALAEGVDVGQLLEQLLAYFRDCMAAAVGCPADSFLYTSAQEQQRVAEAGRRLGLAAVLAAIQILDHTLSRLRYSTQGRTLAEMALVRISKLDDLEELSSLVAELRAGAPAQPSVGAAARPSADAAGRGPAAPRANESSLAAKKKELATSDADRAARNVEPSALNAENAAAIWQRGLDRLGGLLADNAARAERVTLSAADRLAVSFPAKYNSCKTFCERADQLRQLEAALAELTGGTVRVEFAVLGEEASAAAEPPRRALSQRQLRAEKSEHPLVRRAIELFGAHVTAVDGD